MSENQKSITEWAQLVFGVVARREMLVARCNEEMAELLSLVAQPPGGVTSLQVGTECADVFIVLCQIADAYKVDLQASVNYKMKINRARTWVTDGNGLGQHE